MAAKRKPGSSQTSHSGEMAHEGRDRQPARTGIRGIVGDAPDPDQVARPQEVHVRTSQAKEVNILSDVADGLPPEPHILPVKKPTRTNKNARG